MNDSETRYITFEILHQDPKAYRNKLMVLFKGLDWNRSVRDNLGEQANQIVQFCLDPDNIDLIFEKIEPFLGNPDSTNVEVSEVLKSINDYSPIGQDISKENKEKAERKRLVSWIIYLECVMEEAEVELVQVPEENRNSAA